MISAHLQKEEVIPAKTASEGTGSIKSLKETVGKLSAAVGDLRRRMVSTAKTASTGVRRGSGEKLGVPGSWGEAGNAAEFPAPKGGWRHVSGPRRPARPRTAETAVLLDPTAEPATTRTNLAALGEAGSLQTPASSGEGFLPEARREAGRLAPRATSVAAWVSQFGQHGGRTRVVGGGGVVRAKRRSALPPTRVQTERTGDSCRQHIPCGGWPSSSPAA